MMKRTSMALLGVLAVCHAATGQTELHKVTADNGFEGFGFAARGAGDLNGDGFDDFIVTTPYAQFGQGKKQGPDAGIATAYSGADASVLWTREGPFETQFGYAVDAAGDTNLDGVLDVVISAIDFVEIQKNMGLGAPTGAAFLHSGDDGDEIERIVNDFDFSFGFGSAVAGVGDWDQDGRDDVAVSNPEEYDNQTKTSGAGSVRVFGLDANDNVKELATFFGTSSFSQFGHAIAGISDITGDGIKDLLVGAPVLGDGNGAVYGFAGQTNATIGSYEGFQEGLGYSVADAGDIDGDGVSEIIAGAPFNESGAARVISSDFSSVVLDLSGGFEFGSSVAGLGDLNGDGLSDLAVGQPNYTESAVHLFSGADGSSMGSIVDEDSTINFGRSIANAGNINGKGKAELIVATPAGYDDLAAHAGPPGSLNGRVTIYTFDGAAPDLCVDSIADIDFTWSIGDPAPSGVSRTVTNCGESGSCLKFAVADEPNVGWIEITPFFGEILAGNPGIPVAISAIPAGLTPGFYSTTVIFQNVQDVDDREVVNVNLTVIAKDPNLSLVANEGFDHEYVIGTPAPPSDTIEVGNVGPSGSTLDWTAIATNPPAPWVLVTPTSGTVGSVLDEVTPDAVTVTYLVAGLPAGEYDTDIVVTNVANPLDFETVPITLVVKDPRPELCLDEIGQIQAEYTIGGVLPPAAPRTVINCGDELSELPWKAAAMPPVSWLTINPMSGFLPGDDGQSQNHTQAVSIDIDPVGLVEGLFQTVVRFENVAEPENFFDVPVQLIVSRPPAILAVAGPSPVEAQYIIGGEIPADVMLDIQNNGPLGSILDFSFSETPDVPWLFHAPPGGSVNAGDSMGALLQFAVAGLAPATYTTAVRVQDLHDVGQFVEIPVSLEVVLPEPDLCVDEELSEIAVVYQIGGPTPTDVLFDIMNCGHELSTLSYGIVPSTPAGWLTITPLAGILPPGTTSSAVNLGFDPTGLVDGTYETTLRLQNLDDELDFEDLVVRLEVGNIIFTPGDRIQGGLHEYDAAYEIEFDAVQGMKLPVKMKSADGEPPAAAQLSIIDLEGSVVQSEKLTYSQKKSAKTVFKLKNNGRHKLRIEPFKNKFGNFVLNTKRDLPKKAEEHELNKSAGSDLMIPVKVLALPGATIDLKIQPKGSFNGQLAVTAVEMPDGTILDVTGFGQSLGTGGWVMKGVPAPEVGPLVFRLEGFDAGSQKAVISVMPNQPDKGTATLILPIL